MSTRILHVGDACTQHACVASEACSSARELHSTIILYVLVAVLASIPMFRD